MQRIRVGIFVVLFLNLVGLGTLSQAQDDTYQIDLLGISRTASSHFWVSYQFEGIDSNGEMVSIDLTSTSWLQPDPPAYHLDVQATGDLTLFDLISPATPQTHIQTTFTYLRRGLYNVVKFPDSMSCGKSIVSGTPAIDRLSLHSPFPSNTFEDLPPANRSLPDGEFDGQPTARYRLDSVNTSLIDEGQLEIHVLPEQNQVVYFSFDGTGDFLANEQRITGTLSYRYELLPFPPDYEFTKPSQCTPPMLAGLTFFEPSVEWVIREQEGFYVTNQTIDNLLIFHQAQLSDLGYETTEPFRSTGQALLSFKTPEGRWVDVHFRDVVDGTQVDIRLN